MDDYFDEERIINQEYADESDGVLENRNAYKAIAYDKEKINTINNENIEPNEQENEQETGQEEGYFAVRSAQTAIEACLCVTGAATAAAAAVAADNAAAIVKLNGEIAALKAVTAVVGAGKTFKDKLDSLLGNDDPSNPPTGLERRVQTLETAKDYHETRLKELEKEEEEDENKFVTTTEESQFIQGQKTWEKEANCGTMFINSGKSAHIGRTVPKQFQFNYGDKKTIADIIRGGLIPKYVTVDCDFGVYDMIEDILNSRKCRKRPRNSVRIPRQVPIDLPTDTNIDPPEYPDEPSDPSDPENEFPDSDSNETFNYENINSKIIDNYIKRWELITQQEEKDIKVIMVEPLM
ncbi:MAG: hypothetical protein EZS28_012436 [Streblomastix strix]|uniref:Uncharacterized protein n=1 Tax=Streblomastix strix TaxID=222440 RepID=A0A5J4WAQ6_9EUKA|nr:MAG: hypothetical protein EZS28_012436 [Streblomastix strix]